MSNIPHFRIIPFYLVPFFAIFFFFYFVRIIDQNL